MAYKETRSFGGNGGGAFAPVLVSSFAVSSGDELDAVIINDKQYGGNGGTRHNAIHLASDEYFNYLDIRSGDRVDKICLRTNKGQAYGPYGGMGGGFQVFENIRIVTIGGQCGARVDRLDVTMIRDYEPSRSYLSGNSDFIVTANYGQSKTKFYTSERASTAITYRDLCSRTVAMNISVEAEFFAKVSTSLTGTFTTQSEVEQVAAKEKETSSSEEYTVLSGQVGLIVSPVDVFMHSGKAWFAPTAPASFVIANCNAYWQLKEKFPNKRLWDFTRTMDVQAPVLSGKGLDAFGAICYQFPSDNEVTIYQHADWQGRASSFAPGRYNVDSLAWVGNDQASSVRVPSGFKVTLFEHADFSGRSKVLTSSAASLGNDFNDIVSSLIVEKI